MMTQEQKTQKLQEAIEKIEKTYGKGSIMKLSDSANMEVEAISTGVFSLDKALGIGGLPKGRIIEIYGNESGGKTTLSLHIIAEVQKQGGIAGFIDAEHALDPVYARNIGVNIDDLYISQPDCGEQALEITEAMAKSGSVDVIVVDSVAALTPKKEIDGDMGDANVGLHARLMSQAMRKLVPAANSNQCTIIFINQIREKVGVVYGNPEVTTGGRALKFYSSVRLDVRKIETVKKQGEAVSNRVKIKVVKNKVAPPFKEATLEIVFGQGIDIVSDIIDAATSSGIIQQTGAWYTLPDQRRLQGKDAVKNTLLSEPEVLQYLKDCLIHPESYVDADAS